MRARGLFALVALGAAVLFAGCSATQSCPQTYGYDTAKVRPSHQW